MGVYLKTDTLFSFFAHGENIFSSPKKKNHVYIPYHPELRIRLIIQGNSTYTKNASKKVRILACFNNYYHLCK